MNILRETTAMCPQCQTARPAQIVERTNQVYGVVQCPEHPAEHLLSSNAKLYETLRTRSATDLDGQAPENLKFILNYISITNSCNFSCAICATDASPRPDALFLSLEEICQRASALKKRGGRVLHLFGGEPTLHPELFPMINQLRAMGMSVGVVSNGVRLGKDPQLAKNLKSHGASRICLQFDSFDTDTLEGFKRNALSLKRQAIENVLAAGLNLGLNCTATTENLPEVGKLLSHGLEMGPLVKNMTFGVSAVVGRYNYPPDQHIDREMVVEQLIDGASDYDLTLNDVFPLPAYLPWGLQIHSDCGVHLPFLRAPWGIRPLNHYIDIKKFYHRLSQSRRTPNFFTTTILPAWHLLRSARRNKLFRLGQVALGLCFKIKRFSLVNVAVTNYRAASFLDNERLDRCASSFLTSEGAVSGCLHFYMDKTYPGSREYEANNGSC